MSESIPYFSVTRALGLYLGELKNTGPEGVLNSLPLKGGTATTACYLVIVSGFNDSTIPKTSDYPDSNVRFMLVLLMYRLLVLKVLFSPSLYQYYCLNFCPNRNYILFPSSVSSPARFPVAAYYVPSMYVGLVGYLAP